MKLHILRHFILAIALCATTMGATEAAMDSIRPGGALESACRVLDSRGYLQGDQFQLSMIAPSGNALHFAKLSPEATLIIEYEKAGHKIVWIQVQFPSTRSHRRSIEDCVVLNPVEVKFTDSSYMLIFERKKTEPSSKKLPSAH